MMWRPFARVLFLGVMQLARSQPKTGKGRVPEGESIMPESVVLYKAADGGVQLTEEACSNLASQWVRERAATDDRGLTLKALDMAFFLHVPRTAGRVIHRCVLKAGFQDRCERSYDALRINFSDSSALNCGLFVSHQDFRLVDQAYAQGRPWVVTMLRDPVDRVLSSYEFAVEVAARRLGRPVMCNLYKTCTRHVWPWNHLVPYFDGNMNTTEKVRTMRKRRQDTEDDAQAEEVCNATENGACDDTESKADEMDASRDPYACSMYEPLMEFLQHDMSQDLLDNAATFQLLGLTELTPVLNQGEMSGGYDGTDEELDTSTNAERAAQLRRCTRIYGKDSNVSVQLLDFALRRLAQNIDVVMLHERLDDSVSTAVTSIKIRKPETERILGPRFQSCVGNQTMKMKNRKSRGMMNLLWPDGEEVWFGSKTRQRLSEKRIEHIRAKNWMDVALHLHASEIFDARYKELENSGKLKKVKKSVLKEM